MIEQYYRLFTTLIVILLVGIYFFLLSDSGLLIRLQTERQKNKVEENIEVQKARYSELKKQYNRYVQGKQTEEDIINSGYIRKGDRIILFKDKTGKEAREDITSEVTDYYKSGITILRILWLLVTGSILVVIYRKRPNRLDE